MTFGVKQARIEGCVANAHRAVSSARDEASTLADLGLHDDLQLILVELERIQLSLLSSKPYRSAPTSPRA